MEGEEELGASLVPSESSVSEVPRGLTGMVGEVTVLARDLTCRRVLLVALTKLPLEVGLTAKPFALLLLVATIVILSVSVSAPP